MRAFDIVTFDCYGTLIDWESGIASAFESLFGTGIGRAELLKAYARTEPAVESEAFRPYRDVLTESSRRIAEDFGLTIPAGREGFLAQSVPDWPAFPDTNPSLSRLAAGGLRLAILSNVDPDLLAETRKHFTVEFEFAITAGEIRSYKPATPHFEQARRRIGDARWLHAAQSYFHDVVPTRRLGISSAWINRKAETPDAPERPDFEFRDLDAFSRAMTA
jgi:2-haloalkanoic acid dehalogenase type II